MSELLGDENQESQPERLDGPEYWRKLGRYYILGAQRGEIDAEMADLSKQLRRHIHEPISVSAIVHIPEDAEAYLSRSSFERLPGYPEEFEAAGAEIITPNQLVLFNKDRDRRWLVIDKPSPEIQIEVIEPTHSDETVDTQIPADS